MSRSLLFTLPLLAASSFCAAGQTYTAKHIVFKNPGLFSQQQLEAVSGMHPGSATNADTMQAAAQRLADSGYFDDIGAALEGGSENISVIFNLKPTPTNQMLRVGFDNFVWLTHDEVEAAIHSKFPLFIDYLPENSPQADVVSAALTQALAAKGITVRVEHESVEPTLRHPLRTIEFRVVSPRIAVANVHLVGVVPALVPLVQKSVNATARTGYNEGLNGHLTSERILAPLLDAGYVQASLENVAVTPSPAVGDVLPVVVSATLHAGDIYQVSAISFAGSPLLSADAFSASARLHTGDVAARSALLETLAPLDAAYRRQGYMDVVVSAVPTIDAANHQVAYTITVAPGEQYHVHEVKAENLEPAARADYDRGFLMKPGALYNPAYISDFLTNNSALKALAGYTATFKAYAYPATHTVDVVVTFVPPTRVSAQ